MNNYHPLFMEVSFLSEFFYHDHNESTYHIQLDQYCNWYNFTDLKALCNSSAEAKKFKFWNSTHLVYPFWEDPKNLRLLLLTSLFYLLGWNVVTCSSKNPSHPNISMHFLLTVFSKFPLVLTRRISLKIKSFFSWWSFPLFLWPSWLIQGEIVRRNYIPVTFGG